jgi:hypothetical protein
MPFIPGLRATAPQAIGIILPKLPTPLTDGFMGHSNATLAQELLHVAVAQGEARVKPDSVAADFTGKAVVLVSFAGDGRGHVWLPILEFEWSGEASSPGQLCYRSGSRFNKLTKPLRVKSIQSCSAFVPLLPSDEIRPKKLTMPWLEIGKSIDPFQPALQELGQ